MATADQLLAALKAAGLTVKEHPGWKTRGTPYKKGRPVGVLHHHTAPPVPYPIPNLAGAQDGHIKCNMNTKPDGTVWMVAYEAPNYSSGEGMSQVLAQVIAGTPPTKDARDRGWNPNGSDDNTNGNPYFFHFENDHKGNGSLLPPAQLDAIITATVVVNKHFGLHWNNILSHAEWTARKGDPNWNGGTRIAIDQIRRLVKAKETGTTPKPPTPVPPVTKEDDVFPIKKGETREDVKYIQQKMIQMGVNAGNDGIADQPFLDAFFKMVGSPVGGSFISGAEGAIFDLKYLQKFAVTVTVGDKRWAPFAHVADVKTSTPHS